MTDKFTKANPQYKDSVFRDYFNDAARLLALCNALLGTSHQEIEINTLETNFFSGLKNDISCKIGDQFLILLEHQSTVNENMPLRCLTYIAELLNNLVPSSEAVYKAGLIKFPAPKFFVFYDGDNKNEPVARTMKLSDAFGGDSSSLELIVNSININLDKCVDVVKNCNYLNNYSTLIAYVRQGKKQGLTNRDAIIQAIDRCIDENIMRDYLIRKREEVYTMLDYQWNLEDAQKVWFQEGIEKGIGQGFGQGFGQGIETVAVNMLRNGEPIDKVRKFTELSIERIKELAKNNLEN